MTPFSELMRSLEFRRDGSLALQMPADWLQGRTVYGGLQGALAIHAMGRAVDDPELILRSVQITFVGPLRDGELSVAAEPLRRGKSAWHLRATIYQAGKPRLVALGIYGRDRSSQVAYESTMPPLPATPEEARPLPWQDPMPAFLRHFESRHIDGDPLYSGGDKSFHRTYVRLPGEEITSVEHLTLLGDIAPPVVLTHLTEPAPGSSMNWQLDFPRRPEELPGTGWYVVDARMTASEHGYCWQDVNYWTESGQLAMVSRQCMAVYG